MFGKIKSFFKGEVALEKSLKADKAGQVTSQDQQIAALVLLIEMASADKEVAPAEAEMVCKLMQKEFEIPEEMIPDLTQLAIASRKDKGKIDEFVAVINQNFNEEQRCRLLAMIWKIVIADGKVEKFEQRFAVQMQNRFKLSEEKGKKARQLAEQGDV